MESRVAAQLTRNHDAKHQFMARSVKSSLRDLTSIEHGKLKIKNLRGLQNASLSFSYFDIEFLQDSFKLILCRKASVQKKSALGIPFLEPSVIEELMLLVYDKRSNIML